jgi:ATP-dependent Lon protease
MTRENTIKCSSTTKKEQMKKKQMEVNRNKKTNMDSDSEQGDIDVDDVDDSEQEFDILEYRKVLSNLFPSKHMKDKVTAGEKIKNSLKNQKLDDIEDIWESEDDFGDEEDCGKNKKEYNLVEPPKKVNSKHKKSTTLVVVKPVKPLKDVKPVKPLKDVKALKSVKSVNPVKPVKNIKQKIEKSEESEEDDEGDDDDKYIDIDSSKKEKVNIIFTIGGENEDEWSDYDSDYETSSDEDTEDEDESVSSVSSCENENENENEEEIEEIEKRTKKDTTTNDPTVIKLLSNLSEHMQQINEKLLKEDVYIKLKELLNLDPNNKSLQKSITAYESDYKKQMINQEKKDKKHKAKNSRIFKKIIKDKNTMNDYKYFDGLDKDKQKYLIKELREINKTTRIEKPYRISLLECDIPSQFKGIALKKINSLRYMEPGSGEFYKIKNWVDTFMRLPFGKYNTLPVSIDDGVEECHKFMEDAQTTLNNAVYGLNDAKMQIMQMLGQLITNPQSIGTAIAIHGPPGTGKTSLVKEGISKILNRPFAFIALGGATDSSFLEGHSYTYEGSTWGKIVQILVDSKCMNPVIYFDELDKLSETPRGEEIAGILTHLTDTSQNSQFHDKYFSEIDFDLSKCLFIFSYNDETKVNAILKDRMYRIQTKGYDQKQKIKISNNYLIKKIREQVKFKDEDIIIDDQVLGYIIEKFCNKEDGVRNLKRCLEIIHTKLNLYRLMKPGTNLFEEDMSLVIEFPLNITKQIVDKLIKTDINGIPPAYLGMYM